MYNVGSGGGSNSRIGNGTNDKEVDDVDTNNKTCIAPNCTETGLN
jgi:hypothetical protein